MNRANWTMRSMMNRDHFCERTQSATSASLAVPELKLLQTWESLIIKTVAGTRPLTAIFITILEKRQTGGPLRQSGWKACFVHRVDGRTPSMLIFGERPAVVTISSFSFPSRLKNILLLTATTFAPLDRFAKSIQDGHPGQLHDVRTDSNFDALCNFNVGDTPTLVTFPWFIPLSPSVRFAVNS
jgi:hypothetical protein